MRLYFEIHLSFYIRTFIKVLFICNIFDWSSLELIENFWKPNIKYNVISSPEPKARRWAFSKPMVRRPSVRRRRPSSTISNMNISASSGPITMKFYQKHHWDGGKAVEGFGLDWRKTLVSMATDNSHRVIIEKTVLQLFLSCLSSDPFYTCR